MSQARLIIGDVFDVMAQLDDASVDLVLTSPPFLALRSYLPADHPDKAKEIGSEPDPATFIDTLLALTAEWDRLLTPHGSICIELGDTYSGTNPKAALDATEWRGDGGTSGGMGDGRGNLKTGGEGWPLAKSLTLIPELYRTALAYGINPLTGTESPAGRWRIRNVVRWHRPNPPVGALGDKYRPATTDLVIAAKASDRWFDLDAVRTEPQHQGDVASNGPKSKEREALGIDGVGRYAGRVDSNPAGAPPLDTWIIPTHPFRGAHYATWPPQLCTIPIESMCPRHVCTTCGTPRRRMTAVEYSGAADMDRSRNHKPDERVRHFETTGGNTTHRHAKTVGWSDCGHDSWRPGLVFDPFVGSGTTLAVATGHGRDALGIDLDPRNADLCTQRVGMFLTVETFAAV